MCVKKEEAICDYSNINITNIVYCNVAYIYFYMPSHKFNLYDEILK